MNNAKQAAQDKYIEIKERYYRELEELHEQYDIYLHDMKHTMRTIAALARQGADEEILHLIEGLRASLGQIEARIICSHKILNALLSERKAYAQENGIVLELNIVEPLYLEDIADMDLITLMGNILDNAIEAELHAKERCGILCVMRMAKEGRHIIIQAENSYSDNAGGHKDQAAGSVRIGEKHGIGLRSVRKIVRQYGGIMENSKSGYRYKLKIILPVKSGWSNRLI